MIPPRENEMRVAPHNIEAEQALLGAILVNNEAYHASDFLEPSHFYEPLHRAIYDACGTLIRAGKIADPITLRSCLPGEVDVAGLTVNQYLARLAAAATTIINAPDYAKNIRELAHLRTIQRVADDAMVNASSYEMGAREIASDVIEQLDAIVAASSPKSTAAVSIGHAISQGIADAEAAVARGGRITGITTGLLDLDRKTRGFQHGEMTVLGGRTGMGKTVLGLSFAIRAARAGHRGLYYSGEMIAPALGQRAASDLAFDEAAVPYFLMRSGQLTDAQLAAIKQAKHKFAALPLVIDPEPSLTVSQIGSRARRLKQRGGLAFLVVDHLHKVRASDRYRGNQTAETGEISGALAALAKELDLAVILLCQLNRQGEGRDDKRPQLADLRWSGDIEQDADVVLFVYREAYYLERQSAKRDADAEAARIARLCDVQNVMEINIAKQRQGPLGTVKVFCDIACNAIRNEARSGYGAR
jgi:replicative DNA helicase